MAKPTDRSKARKEAATGSCRRRSSDDRKRDAGFVRLGVWVPAARIREIEMLMERWPFADRAEAVSVAIRYLAAKTPTMTRIDL